MRHGVLDLKDHEPDMHLIVDAIAVGREGGGRHFQIADEPIATSQSRQEHHVGAPKSGLHRLPKARPVLVAKLRAEDRGIAPQAGGEMDC